MSKWTPGPWHQDRKVLSRVRDERDYTVCNTLCDDRLEGDYLPNARLIAAAPEMADELKRICDLLDSAFEQGISIPGLATTNKARALLARVEGK